MTDRTPGAPPADAAPKDAIEDRAAQDHELADIETGGTPQPGRYPADGIENREGDVTPDAAEPQVDWDARVQPERPQERDSETDDIEQGA